MVLRVSVLPDAFRSPSDRESFLPMGNHEQDRRFFVLAVLSAIFLLNDFLFIGTKGYMMWLVIDYGSRLLAVGVALFLVMRKVASPAEFGLTGISLPTGFLWMLLLTATGILIDQAGWRFFEKVLPPTQLAAMPAIGNPMVKTFDLTFGVALVALSEEIVFRGYCYTAFKDRMKPLMLVPVSALLFGMIHWSTGLHAIVATAIWGILPMVSVIRTGSAVPAMVAHYLTDLVSLGGFVPESWFTFMK